VGIPSPGCGHILFRSILSLKLLLVTADICFVQKSALITGLALAICGVTLVGVGEWAAGRFESAAPEAGPSAPPADSYDPSRVAGFSTALPVLPETSDHLPAAAPGYIFRRDIPEVRLQFTVADQQGRIVRDLSSGDVRVFDDQTPVSRFSEFERDDNLPLQIGLLIDTSDSVKRVLPEEKAAAAKFLDRVMRPQTDSAFVIAFGGDFKVWQAPTQDRHALADAIARLQQPGWGTRFYDALFTACSGPLAANPEGKLMQRALVVLSDGDDTDSLRDLQDVIAMALRSEVQIYALTIRPRGKAADAGDRVLERLANESGGRVYIARSSKELDGAFAQIEQDLRTQYYVSFPAQQATPGFHSLRVEVNAPQKLEVHARQGYYALAQ
jgi:Ca-activated chloride channel homolog